MRILLVEDENKVSSFVARGLTEERFAVDVAADGKSGLDLATTYHYDLVILDLMLPKIDGSQVLRRIRKDNLQVPVLILTARDTVADKVGNFDAGADDYLTKPFRVEELIMRLRALVRRSAGHAAPSVICGPLSLDAPTGVFELNGLPLKLTALEWRVLQCLILRKDVVVDRLELMEKVYEGDAGTDSNSLEVIVARLRRKIGHDLIETVRGRGYRLASGGS
jgi:two-component system OmpR family response regulator